MQYNVVIVTLTISGILFSIFGIIINKKLYKNVREEVHQERGKVIQRIMKTYSLIQCVGWPLMMITAWLLYVNKVGFRVVQHFFVRYIVIAFRFSYVVFRFYIGFNSLIIAACRYSFIVIENPVLSFGIERMRRLFLASSLGIPILLALFNDATHSIQQEQAWICMFIPPQNLLPEEISVDDQAYQKDIFCPKNVRGNITESLLYNVVNDHISPSFGYGLKICVKVLCLTAMSNIIEGILYSHMFVHLRR